MALIPWDILAHFAEMKSSHLRIMVDSDWLGMCIMEHVEVLESLFWIQNIESNSRITSKKQGDRGLECQSVIIQPVN